MNNPTLSPIVAGAIIGAAAYLLQGCAGPLGVLGTTEQHRLYWQAKQESPLDAYSDTERRALAASIRRAQR